MHLCKNLEVVFLFLYRKDKMKVGVHQFVHLHTRWATAASISVRTVAAKDITGKGDGNGQFAVTAGTCQQQCVCQTIVLYTAQQSLL